MISVIVPAYNVKDYIERTLKSILCQSYDGLEIIVVDDGSTDGTEKIVDKFARDYPDKIKVFHIPNGGVTRARLKGVLQSSGEWIGFVDGDDTIEPYMYEKLLKNAKSYQAEISHCGYQMIFGDGRINYFYNTGQIIQQDHLRGIKDLLEGSIVEPGLCNKIFHKSLFKDLINNNIMDTSIKINEDLLMNYILFSKARKSVFEDVCPYHYNVREDSATHSQLNKNKIYDPILVKKWILEHASDEISDVARGAYIDTCINMYSILCMQTGWKKEKKDIKNKILKNKKSWILLGTKRKILLLLIAMFSSDIYGFIYDLYVRYLQKNPYD